MAADSWLDFAVFYDPTFRQSKPSHLGDHSETTFPRGDYEIGPILGGTPSIDLRGVDG